MRACLENAVSHRTEVKGDNQLNDDKKEEGLCPSMGDIIEFVVKEEEEEGNLDEKG